MSNIDILIFRVLFIISLLSEQEVRDGGEEADGPAEDGDDEDPGEVRGGEGEEGGADDEVSLQGEGEDRQDWCVAGAGQHWQTEFLLFILINEGFSPFWQERSQLTENLAKRIGILSPVDW